MLSLHAGMRVHLALGATDMRKGFDGLAAQVQTVLKADPFSGHLFLFRGRRGDLLKALWWDGQGLVLLAKRLEKGRFIWPTIAREGVVTLTTAAVTRSRSGSTPITWSTSSARAAISLPLPLRWVHRRRDRGRTVMGHPKGQAPNQAI